MDRMVNFSDAVVAIAISLLILPVVDSVSDVTAGDSAFDVFRDNGDRLLAFVLSFVVIARFWMAHHAILEAVTSYSHALVVANMAWLLSIVFMPLPTEVLGVRGSSETFVRVVYIASMLASSLSLLLIQVVIARTPAIWPDDVRPVRPLRAVVVMPALVAASLVVAVAMPFIGMWALLLLALTGPITERLAPGAAEE